MTYQVETSGYAYSETVKYPEWPQHLVATSPSPSHIDSPSQTEALYGLRSEDDARKEQ